MRAFSERNLIGQELKPSSFMTRIFIPMNTELRLMVPRDIYFRAQVLCEDVYELTENRFKLGNLVEMLWEDFLDYVRRKQDIKATYQLLLEYDQGTPNVRLKKYDEKNIEEVPLYPVRKPSIDDEVEVFYSKMKRKDALRGEVMLSDIAQLFPNHHFTLERVLEILLIDFIVKYSKGEAQKIVKEFLDDEK
ncbi:hypothetical protein [Halalkalibacter alkalisediminis]|nr:hypothetical protein [Halalkalibacter alkalisediminis]